MGHTFVSVPLILCAVSPKVTPGTQAGVSSMLRSVLDVMRSASREGGDSLPHICVHSLPSLVFVLEAMLTTIAPDGDPYGSSVVAAPKGRL